MPSSYCKAHASNEGTDHAVIAKAHASLAAHQQLRAPWFYRVPTPRPAGLGSPVPPLVTALTACGRVFDAERS